MTALAAKMSLEIKYARTKAEIPFHLKWPGFGFIKNQSLVKFCISDLTIFFCGFLSLVSVIFDLP